MSAETAKPKATHIASHIEHLKDEILARWREAVRHEPEQAAQIHQLDDQELLDHLPRWSRRSYIFCAAKWSKSWRRTRPSMAASGALMVIRWCRCCASCRFFAAF